MNPSEPTDDQTAKPAAAEPAQVPVMDVVAPRADTRPLAGNVAIEPVPQSEPATPQRTEVSR